MEYLDLGGKRYIVYMDAEFQTYRSSNKDDKLARAGFKLTPPFIYYPNDQKYNTYQFLLNIAYIVIDVETSHTYNYVATFPSLLDSSPAFSDGRILEPAYTVGSPAVLERMKKARPAVDKFVFLSNIPEKDKRAAFYKLNDIYKSQFNQVKINDSIATLHYLLKQLSPFSKVVHKGHTDIDAIANTCRVYGLPLPELNTRNLNHFSHKFVGLYGVEHDKKLGTLQELFASHDEELRHIRDTMITGSEKYMTSIYGEGLELKAHNPLVDCVYALILDIAVAKYLSD